MNEEEREQQSDYSDDPKPPNDPENSDADDEQLYIIEDPMSDIQKERDDLEARLLRVSADYQNYVRRSQQEVVNVRDEQVMSMVRALTTVLDHFDHAMNADLETVSARDLMDGVQIVRDELMKTLANYGVSRIDAEIGEEFDPNRHEAMMRQKAEGIESNHVAAQIQPGYILGNKTIRPAKVSIAE